MIDHEYTNNMVCPYCGHEQTDIYEYKGAYEDDNPIRVDCQECEKEFESSCYVSYSFTTSTVDKEAEAREKAKREAERERRLAERYAACVLFTPGTVIRVKDTDHYAKWMRGRTGVVANKELEHYNPFVSVILDECARNGKRLKSYETFFRPEDIERL